MAESLDPMACMKNSTGFSPVKNDDVMNPFASGPLSFLAKYGSTLPAVSSLGLFPLTAC